MNNNSTQPTPARGTMEHIITKELLSFAAGQTMFCPRCGTCLDFSRVVILDVYKGEQRIAGRTLCCKCYDKQAAEFAQVAAEHPEVRFEITDGRTL